ncbi:MAG: A24 family peptidase [Betaproteobacteria bacterium]
MSLVETLRTSSTLFAVLTTLLGLLVGSFLNVVIHRLPRMLTRDWRNQSLDILSEWSQQPDAPVPLTKAKGMIADVIEAAAKSAKAAYNLVAPRSACPSCGHKITALENIPVMSWLFLRGRCAGCAARIGVRYPVVELMSGALSGYIGWRFGFSVAAAGALVFCWTLIAASFIDVDTQLLPDDLTLPLLWAGLLLNLANVFAPLSSAVVGAVAGYLALWSVYWVFKLVTGKEGMGYGDFKLLGAIGAWLGWQMLPAVILISSLVGAVVGILLIVLARHGRQVPIPFGPYLAAAGVIALFWGESINRAYLQYF